MLARGLIGDLKLFVFLFKGRKGFKSVLRVSQLKKSLKHQSQKVTLLPGEKPRQGKGTHLLRPHRVSGRTKAGVSRQHSFHILFCSKGAGQKLGVAAEESPQ